MITSSNDAVLDTRHYSANFSWNRHMYKDQERFRAPTSLSSQIRNVKQVKRLVVGAWVAAFANNQWFCKKAGLSANSGYWVPPSYNLKNPVTLGSMVMDGRSDWIVQGRFSGHTKTSSSDLLVKVLIDQTRHLIRRATEVGTVHVLGRSAHVRGTLSYTQYGGSVKGTLPPVCHA